MRKSISTQIKEYYNVVELAKEGDVLPKRFVTKYLVDKLSDSLKKKIQTSFQAIEKFYES